MDFVISYFFTNATLTSCPLFFILSSLLGGFSVALLLHPPKSDDKIKKVGNWSELHSWRSNFFQYPHFKGKTFFQILCPSHNIWTIATLIFFLTLMLVSATPPLLWLGVFTTIKGSLPPRARAWVGFFYENYWLAWLRIVI